MSSGGVFTWGDVKRTPKTQERRKKAGRMIGYFMYSYIYICSVTHLPFHFVYRLGNVDSLNMVLNLVAVGGSGSLSLFCKWSRGRSPTKPDPERATGSARSSPPDPGNE